MDDPKEYTVGWICGLLIEFIAAKAFLDETYQSPPEIAHHDSGDIVYALGKIARHNVVIAVSLNGGNKPGSSAVVAKRMLNSFPHVRIGLMVGIGSGVPSPEHDVRLGDVVVGSSVRGEGGIVQYSFNRPTQSQDASFEQTMPVNQPPVALQAAVSTLERQYGLKYLQLERRIEEASAKRGYLQDYARPNSHSDKPPGSSILHPTSADEYSGESRENSTYPVKETPKDKSQIHYGLIASSTQIMDNATMRDQLAKNTNILCYETEAADLSNDFPCLVIRGICDYNEAQRNKKWRGFAAMVAAAYTTELLRFVSPRALDADNIPSGLLGKGKRGPMNHDTTMTKIAMITTRNDHDVNEQRGEYGNALRAVARQDRASMAAGSFGEDADFDPPSGQYGNAFKAALKGGHGPDRYGAGAALKRSRNDLFQTWLGEAYLNENARRSLRFQWEIPAVYEKMRRKSLPSDGSDVLDLLSGFIVLTGAGETFECSTCSDFLHRRWRYAGSIALRIMSIGIRQLRFGEMISSDLLQHKDPTAKHFDMDGFLVQNSTTREIERSHRGYDVDQYSHATDSINTYKHQSKAILVD
ncbi:purine and uridine phosphorylase [Colletotrichum scovillei]|uniref:Purine and uridine phosphorylase n=1 Tax=Colletotrichum scovillei TaxID=1209932 RepID=A0A9P7UIJ5_9PEZI|nr:purine and uridine phosphorylase [Colletotrichum scovillei]KAG7069659.1 purine and uridine phosphorylase [Colletotrichum scovillei]KAG7073533.1 purine and uridine phosphorylase [Colletotrichum scovillei]